ncbi:hypothetical protein [Fodinicurvata sp. EGI_FJ10296]|uniref:hypothetical protein n=1 Tax=Fodinicurvata sp. EGI_FJ10296 TaxID=3231908 RepID=UPI003455D46B
MDARKTRRGIGTATVSAMAISVFALTIAATHLASGHDAAGMPVGTVAVWDETTNDGTIRIAGFDLPLAMVEALDPTDTSAPPMTIMALERFSDEVRDSTSIDHVSVDWGPFGHPPARFSVPHFDIHFYFDDPETIAAIDCTDATMPDAAIVPAGYVLPPLDDPHACVPAMGYHAAALDEIQSENPFDATMILGYYGGQYIFLEPMVTLEHLLARESFVLDVPPVADGTEAGQPTAVRFAYREADDSYRVSLIGFGEHGLATTARMRVAQ